MINRCWAKFPDPPDPSTLDHADEDALQRDVLSIECSKTLNEALWLNHDRRDCSNTNSLSTSKEGNMEEGGSSRKFGRFGGTFASRINRAQTNHSQELTQPTVANVIFSSFRSWLLILWAFSGLGFLVVILAVYFDKKRRGNKDKRLLIQEKIFVSGFMETKMTSACLRC
ncbi:Peptidyl serine alpha-galactosyltransferase [Quillaja saponaria]|uniref:Peptidyl serine alpha-galactosyltransferase n=1 Tax=Quillaja saponaria TaxID=32244 RepID=A0AAD7Q4H5_QUISA|nr:Peptidyl serine alpha-galactosyltransferase [Quillaja saponaria]